MSCLVALRLLIRSVVARRVICSSWISYPAYLLLLYHMLQWASAKPTQFQAVWTPLTLARTTWQPGRTVGKKTHFFPARRGRSFAWSLQPGTLWRHFCLHVIHPCLSLGEITVCLPPSPIPSFAQCCCANKWVRVHLGCPSCSYCLAGDSSLLQHLTNRSQ